MEDKQYKYKLIYNFENKNKEEDEIEVDQSDSIQDLQDITRMLKLIKGFKKGFFTILDNK